MTDAEKKISQAKLHVKATGACNCVPEQEQRTCGLIREDTILDNTSPKCIKIGVETPKFDETYSQSVVVRMKMCPTMARERRSRYDRDYKKRAVKLAKEIGGTEAAKELGIPRATVYTWLRAARVGELNLRENPESARCLTEEFTVLREHVKDQDREIQRLKEENEFLEEVSAFFAARYWKSLKTKQ